MANEKRLIDANALKKEIVDWKVNLHPQNQDYATGYFSALSAVEGMLAYVPTVDAVEVVRCKDCDHCDISHPTGKPTPWYLCKHNRWTVTRPDDFCSYGERRTDA